MKVFLCKNYISYKKLIWKRIIDIIKITVFSLGYVSENIIKKLSLIGIFILAIKKRLIEGKRERLKSM